MPADTPTTDLRMAFLASEKPIAKEAIRELVARYGNCDPGSADVLVPLGGDGFMLSTLRRHLPLLRRGLPVYGMNRGTVGFLMNGYDADDLPARIRSAQHAEISPLRTVATAPGGEYEALAFNEVSLLRQQRQAAHINIHVDGRERMERLIADGIIVATPAGSTAYNLSAHGPVIPLGTDAMALTPISAFRPRRWRGALLKGDAEVHLQVLDPERRPVSCTADDQEFRRVSEVRVRLAREVRLTLLFDADHALDEKILREQFAA